MAALFRSHEGFLEDGNIKLDGCEITAEMLGHFLHFKEPTSDEFLYVGCHNAFFSMVGGRKVAKVGCPLLW
jgi:hypothetical protein